MIHLSFFQLVEVPWFQPWSSLSSLCRLAAHDWLLRVLTMASTVGLGATRVLRHLFGWSTLGGAGSFDLAVRGGEVDGSGIE